MASVFQYFKNNKKFKKNSISYYGQFFVSTFTQIVFPALMILIWGADKFGIIIYLISIPAFLSILILNFSSGTRQEMIQVKIKKDYNLLKTYYSNFVFLALASYVIYIVVSLFVINFFDFKKLDLFLKNENIKLILYFIFSSQFIKFFETIYSNKISYYGKFYIIKYMDTGTDLILKTSMIIIGLISDLLSLLFFIYLVINLIKVCLYIFLGRNVRELTFDYSKINYFDCIFLIKKNLQYIFISFDELIKNSLMPLLIGYFFEFRIVTLFTTLKTMFYFFPQKFFLILNEVLQFDYIKLYYDGKTKLLKKIFIRQNVITLLFLTLFLLFCHFFGNNIYNLWTNYEFSEINIQSIIYLIIFECFFISTGISLITVLKSFNKANIFSIISFFLYGIICLLSFLFFQMDYSIEIIFKLSLLSSFVVFLISISSLNETKKYFIKKNV